MSDFNVEIMKEYEPINDIWSEEDEIVDRLKRKIKKLCDSDRILFIMYCEMASYRKMAEYLNCSHSLIGSEIKRIKRILLDD